MKTKLLICAILLSQVSFGQNKLSGHVSGNEPLSNVNITIQDINRSSISKSSGYYEFLDIPDGNYTIVFSHIGYNEQTVGVELTNEDRNLDITLTERIIDIGEATIVSSKSNFKLKDDPLPVELVDISELESSTKLSLPDILNSESGVTVLRDGPWASSVNVRGLTGQNLVYLIDGSRIETSTNIAAGLSLMDVNDFESIEVIKGGISSLYGTGATGGVINAITKKASFNETPYVSSQIISSYNSVNNGYSNYLNVRSGGENWSFKLHGSHRKADDTEIPDGVLPNSSFQDENFSSSILYSPYTNLLIDFDFQKFSAFEVGIPGGAPFPTSALAKYNYAKRMLLSPKIELKNISKHLISAEIKYYHQLISRSVEIKPNALVTSNPNADHTTNGLLFQTDWYLNENANLISGIDYWQREYKGERRVVNNAKNVISLDKPVPDSKFASLGFFAKTDLRLTNEFKLSVSGRYDFINISNDETKNPVYIINNGTKNENAVNELASYQAYDEYNRSLSGSVGAVYTVLEDYDIVLNAGYNFRSPSLEERYQYIDLGGIVYLGNPGLEPEEGIFLDGGIRIWKEKFNFQINTFLNTFSNMVNDKVLYPDSIYVKNNIGKSRLYGFDGKLEYNFIRDYVFYSSFAYVVGQDISDDSYLPQIPPLNGRLGIKIPFTDLFKVDVSMTFAADQNNIAEGESSTGGFSYYDFYIQTAQLDIGILRFKVIGGVENLLNKKYREHLSTYRGIERLEPGRNIFAKLILDL